MHYAAHYWRMDFLLLRRLDSQRWRTDLQSFVADPAPGFGVVRAAVDDPAPIFGVSTAIVVASVTFLGYDPYDWGSDLYRDL